MARYSTQASTPDEFRLLLIEELKRRLLTASDASARATSAKRKNWEQGRADCYRDLVEFLMSLEIKQS